MQKSNISIGAHNWQIDSVGKVHEIVLRNSVAVANRL